MTLTSEYRHEPVLLEEIVEALSLVLERRQPRKKSLKTLQDSGSDFGPVVCDCTLGGAGHSKAFASKLLAYNQDLLESLGLNTQPKLELYTPKALLELESLELCFLQKQALLLGIDQDDLALEVATARLNELCQDKLVHRQLKGNFSQLDSLLGSINCPGVDFFLFDIGVSSPQFDIPERGFSYRHDAQLDMRMDPRNQTLNAHEVINTYNEADLTRIFRAFGEEKFSARIAQRICQKRACKPIDTTLELAELVKEAIPAAARRAGGHPAKRVFQALRIEVNKELEVLEHALERALAWLRPQGVLAVISYHSLEDRLVKQIFAKHTQSCICPPDLPVCSCGLSPDIKVLTKKPLVASAQELERNPRSSSAKLRIAQKL